MKKLLMIIFVLCLLCAGCAPVPAPTPAPEAVAIIGGADGPTTIYLADTLAPMRIEPGESKAADLNGDGREETVSILAVEDDPGAEADETVYYFVVTDDTGKEMLRQCSEAFTYLAYGYVADVDADGRAELFFCQTFMSDDLVTKCWRSEGETFRGLCFLERDCETCVSDCYGVIDGFGDNCVRVSAYIDVLGTRGGLREYVIDGDVFVPAPDSLWDFTSGLPIDDPDTWEFYTLTTAKPLPATINGQPDTLPAGTALIITGSDAKTVAAFHTQDGVDGRLAISPSAQGWGWDIAGEPEQNWFTGYLPYAG